MALNSHYFTLRNQNLYFELKMLSNLLIFCHSALDWNDRIVLHSTKMGLYNLKKPSGFYRKGLPKLR